MKSQDGNIYDQKYAFRKLKFDSTKRLVVNYENNRFLFLLLRTKNDRGYVKNIITTPGQYLKMKANKMSSTAKRISVSRIWYDSKRINW